ncbi:MAG TPA: ABC transporter permease [Lachnospiraceae bacterium]|nr:ABC transporter permease [Lachnospiraceae bacterium]
MKKFIQRLTRKQFLWGLSGMIAFCIGLVLYAVSTHVAVKQDTQDIVSRWSDKKDVSQVSCFFSREAQVSEDSIHLFEHNLDKALEEASIVTESDNEDARLWADAYSATGNVSLESDRGSMTVSAVGIGGDFFLFHPLYLISGAYFSGNDVMQDYIVVDEDVAWQLFGSNDVVGQLVTISGIPHIITGVIKREEGKLAEAAGLSSSVAYVSYSTLSQYGTDFGINTYEIVMPNPVSGYARKYVSENIGVDENNVDIVENTTRYSLLARIKLLTQFGTRSMSSKAIIYPYWENIARGYEDILGFLFLIMVLFFMYPSILLLIGLISAWKHKTWTAKGVFLKIQDKWQRQMDKFRCHRAQSKSLKKSKFRHEEEKNEKKL